jgi:hypothetical protein
MVGLFNEFDSYTNSSGNLDLGAQVYFSPVEGLDAYLNVISSNESGSEIDLTATYQVTDKFMLGLNTAKRTTGELFDEEVGAGLNFNGLALYTNYAFSESFALGFRGETYQDEDGGILGEMKSRTNSYTVSANIGSGPLKLIPEIRFDKSNEKIFMDGDTPVDSFAQFIVAAVFAF